jgi:hypothetical protein
MAWLKLGNRNLMGGRNLISAQNKKKEAYASS